MFFLKSRTTLNCHLTAGKWSSLLFTGVSSKSGTNSLVETSITILSEPITWLAFYCHETIERSLVCVSSVNCLYSVTQPTILTLLQIVLLALNQNSEISEGFYLAQHIWNKSPKDLWFSQSLISFLKREKRLFLLLLSQVCAWCLISHAGSMARRDEQSVRHFGSDRNISTTFAEISLLPAEFKCLTECMTEFWTLQIWEQSRYQIFTTQLSQPKAFTITTSSWLLCLCVLTVMNGPILLRTKFVRSNSVWCNSDVGLRTSYWPCLWASSWRGAPVTIRHCCHQDYPQYQLLLSGGLIGDVSQWLCLIKEWGAKLRARVIIIKIKK